MKKTLFLLATALIFASSPVLAKKTQGMTDDAIKEKIIQRSLQRYYDYKGPCACPYDTTRNGRSCGKRSAYSRPGGESPICYKEDVTKQMIQNYKKGINNE